MGAVLLCRTDAGAAEEQAIALLTEKGFRGPAVFECGLWRIHALPKLASGRPNWIRSGDSMLVCAGTPVYKKLNDQDSIRCLLDDWLGDGLDLSMLAGQYTLLFCRDGHISILNDPMNTKHLFADTDTRIISSSFLAAVCGLHEKVHLDRPSVYEALLTGFIMRPGTLIKEVKQLTAEDWDEGKAERYGVSFLPNPTDFRQAEHAKTAREACIGVQTRTLLEWFGSLREAARNGIDLGVSGGYDSRLALACMNTCYPDRLHIHTHATGSVHSKDSAIATKMADAIGKTCHIVPTKPLTACDRVDDVLRESVLYFDGRTSFAIGGCGEVYTAEYRKRSTENTPMTVTGVGGELYRNVFSIGKKKIRLRSFLRGKVFSRAAQDALGPEIGAAAADRLAERIARRLDVDAGSRLPKAAAHRYYCEVMMPDGQGNAIDAYNQVSCCVAPFLEPGIIRSGYASIRFHGSGGDFEGDMIDRINHELASIGSSYGYPLNQRPASAKIKEALRSLMPAGVWEWLGDVRRKAAGKVPRSAADLEAICARSDVLGKALERMEALFPEISFGPLKQEDESCKRLIFMAMTIDLLAERICPDE